MNIITLILFILAIINLVPLMIFGVFNYAKGVCISIFCVLFFGVGAIIYNEVVAIPTHTPTAIDVYRGKTTLEITYKDSVAIDSTVVYKAR